ncbi:MAG: hypothetical protein L6R36_007679 [Xanthoria steineri]|nr:MAG: hypothetical protein L6R36_007679 [Xanthoria steineri]
MSNSDKLANREVDSAMHSSDISSDTVDREIELFIQRLKYKSDLLGASHLTHKSDGDDLDDIQDSEDIEDLSETTGATDDDEAVDAEAALLNSLSILPGSTLNLAGTKVQGDLISCLPRRPFHAGLGSLRVLPPEIRLQIWEMIIPTIKFCIQLEPEQRQRLRTSDLLKTRRPDQPKIESLKTLGLLSASKQIYHEIDTHIYHNHSPVSDRSLVIIFTNTCDPSARRVSLERARSSNPGLVLDGTCSSGALPFRNFAAFASIKLLIELPGPIAGALDFDIVARSVMNFSNHFKTSLLRTYKWIGWPSGSPRIEMLISTRMRLEAIRDDFEYEVSLHRLAFMLEPFQGIRNSTGATVEADYDLRYGTEWLSELLSQVANDMQSSGYHERHQWRQKNMEIALA